MEKIGIGDPVITDVLIIGAGGAGLRAAIEASKRGAGVAIVDKRLLGYGGATVTALYSACAALGHTDPEDNWEVHFEDVLKGGHYVNHYSLAKVYAQKAPSLMVELDSFGTGFERNGDKFDLRGAPGHTYRRAFYWDCATGTAVIKGLLKEFKKQKRIAVFEYTWALDLLMSGGRISGAICLDLERGKLFRCLAKAVILATGGGMELYRESTAPSTLTGDGYAMAYRAGAELRDMEFVQFFPASLVHPRGPGINLTVGAMMRYRTGGRFYNRAGEHFMEKYDAKRGDMATRDMLAYSITKEIKEGRGTDRGAVYLDLSIAGPEALRKEYGPFLDKMIAAGVDITRHPIEVRPMALFFCGGISINERCETNIAGLYAAGEAAGGVHGSNRLAGDALSEIIVFGAVAGEEAVKFARANRSAYDTKLQADERLWLEKLNGFIIRKDGQRPVALKQNLQNLAHQCANTFRDKAGLQKGLNSLPEMEKELPSLSADSKSAIFNIEVADAVELENLLLLAKLIMGSAKIREESRGVHHREDFPQQNPSWRKNIYIRKGAGGPYFMERGVIEN